MPPRRVKVDTSRLRSLGGIQNVVARPVDTYVRPTAPTEDVRSKQILNALSTFSPAVNALFDDKKAEIKQQQSTEGEKTFYNATPEERKKFLQQIKSGEIDETQSPFWVEGYARSLLRNHAKDFGDQLIIGWDTEKDKPNFDFNTWANKTRQEYAESNGLDGFRADILNEEFNEVTQRFEAQVQQRNFEHQLKKARDSRTDLMLGELTTDLETMDDMFDQQGVNIAPQATASINARIQTAIDQGTDPKIALDTSINFLEGKARELAAQGGNWEQIVEVMEGLKNKSSVYGISNKAGIETLKKTLESIEDKAETEAFEQEQKEDLMEAVKLRKALLEGLQENKYKTDWWNSEETVKQRNRLAVLSQSESSYVDREFQDRGQIKQVSDQTTYETIYNGISDGNDMEDAIDLAVKDKKLSIPDAATLENLNNQTYSRFKEEYGISGIESALEGAIKQTTALDGLFGNDASRNLLANNAKRDLTYFIKDIIPQVEKGDLTREAAMAKIDKEAQRLEKYYRNKAEEQNRSILLENVPTADDTTMSNWQQGISPWQNSDGLGWNKPMSTYANMFNTAVLVLTNPSQKENWLTTTDLGRMLAPMVAGGVDPDEALRRFVREFEAEQERLKAAATSRRNTGNSVNSDDIDPMDSGA